MKLIYGLDFTFSNYLESSDERKALKHYLNVAKSIRAKNVKNLNNDILLKIENIILNQKVSELQRFESFTPISVQTSKMFVAINTPSYTGKTQLAFSLPKIRPLYFIMIKPENGQQDIYKNFLDFFTILNSCALTDIQNSGLDMSADFDSFLIKASATALSSLKIRFYTLGLLKEFIVDGDRLSSASKEEWMKFYSTRRDERHSISICPITIKEFNNFICEGNCKEKYFVLLDEFHEDKWCVFVRNIVRCTGLMCVVASTNSKVSNLTGMNSAKASRGQEDNIWAAVVTQLPPTDHVQIMKSYSVSQSIGDIVKVALPRDKDAIRSFLNFLKTDQIKNLRPGIAEIVFSKLNDFNCSIRSTESVTLKELLTFLFHGVADLLVRRKTRILSQARGRAANISLLLSTPFCNLEPLENDQHRNVNFINDHLYYLINTVESSSWAFLVYLGEQTDSRSLIVFKNGSRIPFEIFSFLKESEFILVISCMFIGLRQSTSSVMQEIIRNSKSADSTKCPNPNASGNSGNYSETCCLIALIDSTHRFGIDVDFNDGLKYDFKNSIRSICGVRGDMFLRNLLSNLVKFETKATHGAISEMAFLAGSEDVFKSMHLPFLMSANMDIPSKFKGCISFFKILTGKQNKSQLFPYMETCCRSRNLDQIDAEFRALFLANPIIIADDYVNFGRMRKDKISSFGRVVVEMKDHARSITLPDYFRIILKSQSFCKSCKNLNSSKRCKDCEFSDVLCSGCVVELVTLFPNSKCSECRKLESSDFKCKLHLLFCNSISKTVKRTIRVKRAKAKDSSFQEKSRLNLLNLSLNKQLKYNFYRVMIDSETGTLAVGPLMEDLLMHPDPLVTFIVIELRAIDGI
jgi:hypothetical protein